MDWGMKNRISQIIKPETGRTVMLAVDHGYFLGPTTGLEEPRKIIAELLPYADSLMLTRGILRTSVDPKISVPIVLRVSGANSIIGDDLSNEAITVSVEDAIRLNVSAVALSIYVGGKYEHQTLKNLATLINECEKYGIPVFSPISRIIFFAAGRVPTRRIIPFFAATARINSRARSNFSFVFIRSIKEREFLTPKIYGAIDG